MFTFVMKMEGLEFIDALRLLADKAGVKLRKQDPQLISKRSKLYDICEEATEFFENILQTTEAGGKISAYLKARGLNDEGIKTFRLGYAPNAWRALFTHLDQLGYEPEDIETAGFIIRKSSTVDYSSPSARYYDRFRNRITFPFFYVNGRVVGFTGRIFEVQTVSPEKAEEASPPAKYVNSPETPIYEKGKVLYGLNHAKLAIKKQDECVLVEGNLDLIMSHQVGAANAVATSGTALTSFQLRVIKRYTDNLVVAFDMDTGGENATKRGIDLARREGFNIRVARLPDAKDPAEYILRHPGEWQKRIKESKSIYEFYLESAFKQFPGEDVLSKKRIAATVLPILKDIPNKIEQVHWVGELASRLRVREEDILYELSRIKPGKVDSFTERNKEEETAKKSRKELLEERLLFVLVNQPQKLTFVKESSIILSPEGQEIVRYLEGGPRGADASPNVKEFLDSTVLFTEYEKDQEIDYDEEFEFILNELRTVPLREELEQLSLSIQEAERAGDEETVHKLLQRFQVLSANL